ncbi:MULTISPECIES: site-specific integrase [Chryseobacterium group]|uniref:Site-specific integrase n=1 Tax=Chryseobacterium suipulveris TaxID=2929800 RepID=A0ABY4BNI8_9FLAO|nr:MULTISPECIES: site-specific integrase [Chryseobacterium]MBP7172784.1 tyrosine-type recombinase/integrase [Cloacibacterium sp.]UOE40464.1 site-specific integrase [Chryseobacterium suipulveris]WES97125.1 tyrosine-type recombinase/integrase [Chryseobacterium arthrosphaerae]WFB66747.1 tyrosine-type recombinase/integrase [Chryseobacterium sp. WX]
MNIKYHAQFLLDREKDNPTAKLRYRIKWDGNIVAFNLGYRVEVQKWSTETQRCKANTTHGNKKVSASVINRKIQLFESACEKTFQKYEIDDLIPNQDQFREWFNVEIGRTPKEELKSEKNFFVIYDMFVNEESINSQWNFRTLQKMKTQKKVLEEFDHDISFEKFNEQYLSNYQRYLEGKNHKNSTISKELAALKWFLKWAMKKGYTKSGEFEKFKPKIKNVQKKIIFLNKSELKRFTEYEIPTDKSYLEKIRDVFLFQCFTGLRYSDVFNLKRSDVKDGYLEITTLKTADNLIIELNSYSRKLLNKYIDVEFEHNKALPVISNQKMNDYLKELAELAEIDELVTQTYFKGNERIEEVLPKYSLMSTHAGRRTFVCNALSLGIPPQVVMKWTGHSDYKAMKPYIDIADEIKATAMEKFDSF